MLSSLQSIEKYSSSHHSIATLPWRPDNCVAERPGLPSLATLATTPSSVDNVVGIIRSMAFDSGTTASPRNASDGLPSNGPILCHGYTARRRLRLSGLPRSRLRGSGHRRRSPSRTLRSSSSTSALTLTRQRANVSPVAPAARSSFHRARIAAISSRSDRSVFDFVIA